MFVILDYFFSAYLEAAKGSFHKFILLQGLPTTVKFDLATTTLGEYVHFSPSLSLMWFYLLMHTMRELYAISVG